MLDERSTPGGAVSKMPRPRGIGVVVMAMALGACGAEQENSAPATEEMTAEGIVALSAEAMGVETVQTLRLVIEYPDHDYLVTSEVERPDRIWSGADDVYALGFDGSAAWYQDFRPAEGGEPQELMIVPEEQLKDFEVDIANYFPAYFDHPAEYLGREVIESGEAHKLEVALPLGALVTYWVDASTHLAVKMTSHVVLEGAEYTWERTFFDHESIDGVMYPRSFTYPGRDGQPLVGTFQSVEINSALDDARFAAPGGAR